MAKSRFNTKDVLRRCQWTGWLHQEDGPYCDQILINHTDLYACSERVPSGDAWFHPRLRITCGDVGCCENSKN